MTIQDVIFDLPAVFYFILFIPIFVWIFWRLFQFRKQALEKFGKTAILRRIARERSSLVYWSKSLAMCLLWVLLIIALAQPKGNGRYPESSGTSFDKQKGVIQQQAHEVVFLIDASASMGVQDTPYGQSRLELSQEIADQILSLLEGQSASLFAFTSGTTQLSPETNDYLFLRMMLEQMQINEGENSGTHFYETLLDVRKRYLDKPAKKIKTLVILSDGGDTRLEELQGAAYHNELLGIAGLLQDAPQNGMHVYAIGVGSGKGGQVPDVTFQGSPVVSRLEEELLRELASKGGGRYYQANEMSPLALANDLVSRMEKGPAIEKERVVRLDQQHEPLLIYDEYFQYPLGIAIFLLAFMIFFPDSSLRRVS